MTKFGTLMLAVLLSMVVGARPGSAHGGGHGGGGHGGGAHGARHSGGSGNATGVGHRNWRHDQFHLDYPRPPQWAMTEGLGPGEDRGA
jgi:hypothetical protein